MLLPEGFVASFLEREEAGTADSFIEATYKSLPQKK